MGSGMSVPSARDAVVVAKVQLIRKKWIGDCGPLSYNEQLRYRCPFNDQP